MPRLQLKGVNLTPRRETFDAIEIASRDEIAALQLKRLKWTLNHAYNNVAHYRKSFEKAGVHPDDLKSLDDLQKFPFTDQRRSAQSLSVRDVRHPARTGAARACLVRHHRQSRPSSAIAGAISTPGPM